jgi:hypothetical protein
MRDVAAGDIHQDPMVRREEVADCRALEPDLVNLSQFHEHGRLEALAIPHP